MKGREFLGVVGGATVAWHRSARAVAGWEVADVAEGDKDHGGIPVTPAIGLGGIDQPIDLGASQVLPRPIDRFRFSTRRSDCSIYSGWCHPFQR